jgi:hypothetical protein
MGIKEECFPKRRMRIVLNGGELCGKILHVHFTPIEILSFAYRLREKIFIS